METEYESVRPAMSSHVSHSVSASSTGLAMHEPSCQWHILFVVAIELIE